MVSNGFMMTVASDDLPKGTGAPKKRTKKKLIKQTTAFATLTISARDTPASAATEEYGGTRQTTTERDTPMPATSDEATPQPVPKTQAPTTNVLSKFNYIAESGVVDTIEDAAATHMKCDEAESGTVLDAADSERQYYHDPFTLHKREIWRPGDGNGDKKTDYYDRPGLPPPLEQRRRFYQSDHVKRPFSLANMPPKWVILDDRAAWEVSRSDVPRTKLLDFWEHDFGGAGTIRTRRPHRGRAAVADQSLAGDLKYQFALIGKKKEKYYFKGEKDYKPVIYRSVQAAPSLTAESAATPEEQTKKRKASSPLSGQSNLRKHGHNQYTKKEEMVKYGAPSEAKGRRRYRARINTFLRRSPSPTWSKDRSKLYGGVGDQARAFTASMALQGAMGAAFEGPALVSAFEREESMWVDQTEEPQSLWIDQSGPQVTTSEGPESASDETRNRAPVPLSAEASATIEQELAHIPKSDLLRDEELRRKKVCQPLSYLESMATAEQDHQTVIPSPTDKADPSIDSGSYATQLEQELMRAMDEIELLKKDLEQSERRVEQLEAEVIGLQSERAGARAIMVP